MSDLDGIRAETVLVERDRFSRRYRITVSDDTHVRTHEIMVSSRHGMNDEDALKREVRKRVSEFAEWRGRKDRVMP